MPLLQFVDAVNPRYIYGVVIAIVAAFTAVQIETGTSLALPVSFNVSTMRFWMPAPPSPAAPIIEPGLDVVSSVVLSAVGVNDTNNNTVDDALQHHLIVYQQVSPPPPAFPAFIRPILDYIWLFLSTFLHNFLHVDVYLVWTAGIMAHYWAWEKERQMAIDRILDDLLYKVYTALKQSKEEDRKKLNAKIKELEDKNQEERVKLARKDSIISNQAAKIKEQGSTIKDQEMRIQEQENKVKKMQRELDDHETYFEQIDQDLVVDDTKDENIRRLTAKNDAKDEEIAKLNLKLKEVTGLPQQPTKTSNNYKESSTQTLAAPPTPASRLNDRIEALENQIAQQKGLIDGLQKSLADLGQKHQSATLSNQALRTQLEARNNPATAIYHLLILRTVRALCSSSHRVCQRPATKDRSLGTTRAHPNRAQMDNAERNHELIADRGWLPERSSFRSCVAFRSKRNQLESMAD